MRSVVSIAGPSGSGKSQLALAVVRLLGEDVAARVPMDWYLVPRPLSVPVAAWLLEPLRYDLDALRVLLTAPDGEPRLTPPFDFATFTRSDVSGTRKVVPPRPVMVLDGIAPLPGADLVVGLDVPDAVRRSRIETRDFRWGTQGLDRWDHLEMSRVPIPMPDLTLDGAASLDKNAARVACALALDAPPAR